MTYNFSRNKDGVEFPELILRVPIRKQRVVVEGRTFFYKLNIHEVIGHIEIG